MQYFAKKKFNGEDFLIVCEKMVGYAYPANIVTILDGKPKILSVIDYETEYKELFYSPFGKIVCMRGNGISIGSHNVIPYYWNGESGDFVPYAIKEIGVEDLRALDTQGIVERIDDIGSVYQRDNGLIHVNYLVPEDMVSNNSITVSKTYVQAEKGLRIFDFENDASYGFFLECLSITE